MGSGYRIDYDGRSNVVRVRARGALTHGVIEDALEQISRLGLRPGYRELVDLRAVRSFDMPPPAVRRLAARFDHTFGDALAGGRHAIVAPSDVGFGMARMFELARGSEKEDDLRVFRGLSEARAWLGLDDDGEPAGDG